MATTIIVAQISANRNGRMIHNDAARSMPIDRTANVGRVTSRFMMGSRVSGCGSKRLSRSILVLRALVNGCLAAGVIRRPGPCEGFHCPYTCWRTSMKCFGFLITKIPSRSPNLLRKPAFTALPLVTCVRGMPGRRAWTWHLDPDRVFDLVISDRSKVRSTAAMCHSQSTRGPSGRTTGSETRSHTVTSSIQFSGTANPRRPAEQRH